MVRGGDVGGAGAQCVGVVVEECAGGGCLNALAGRPFIR